MEVAFLKGLTVGWRDIFDILLVSILIYNIIILIKQTRAVAAILGLIAVIITFFLSRELGLYTLNWILESVLSSLFLLVVIVFQRDIRHGLTSLGAKQMWVPSAFRKKHSNTSLEAICEAVDYMAQRKIGALIVIERTMPLGDTTERGVRLDAVISKELLIALFWPNSPLHDGATFIRNDKIVSAGCILPLSTAVAKRDYGTRHRAALGITEETDAIVLVVSEERGVVSLAVEGKLTGGLDRTKLPRVLTAALERI